MLFALYNSLDLKSFKRIFAVCLLIGLNSNRAFDHSLLLVVPASLHSCSKGGPTAPLLAENDLNSIRNHQGEQSQCKEIPEQSCFQAAFLS